MGAPSGGGSGVLGGKPLLSPRNALDAPPPAKAEVVPCPSDWLTGSLLREGLLPTAANASPRPRSSAVTRHCSPYALTAGTTARRPVCGQMRQVGLSPSPTPSLSGSV